MPLPELPPTPEANDAMPLPGANHPMHGLRHASLFAPVVFQQAERQLGSPMPNPLAVKVWDEWCRQYQHDLDAANKKSKMPDFEFDGSDRSGDERNSRRGSDASSHWGSDREQSPVRADLDITPIHWPPLPRLDSPQDVLPPEQRTFAEYPLPPSMPLPTVRKAPELEPDEHTIRYGGLNADYYGGSNIESFTSLDMVPWHLRRQTQRTQRGVKRADSWTSGRGSKRHVWVVNKTGEEAGEGGQEEHHPKERSNDSD